MNGLGLARARHRSALLGLAGHTLVSRVIGLRGVLVVGWPLAGVRVGRLVAVPGGTWGLGVQGYHVGRRPEVRVTYGALRADTVGVHQGEEKRGQHPRSPRPRCTRAGPRRATGRPGHNHAAEHSGTPSVALPWGVCSPDEWVRGFPTRRPGLRLPAGTEGGASVSRVRPGARCTPARRSDRPRRRRGSAPCPRAFRIHRRTPCRPWRTPEGSRG